MSTHVTRPRTSLCFVKISGFHVKLSTRNRVHSPADSLSRCTPSSHRAGGESCSTPHHPMRVNLPTVICTTTGMSKNTFQKIIFPENKANNRTYRHQTQPKCWGQRDAAVAGRPPYHFRHSSQVQVLTFNLQSFRANGHLTLGMKDT